MTEIVTNSTTVRIAPTRRLELEGEQLRSTPPPDPQALHAYYHQVLGQVQDIRQVVLPPLPPQDKNDPQWLLERGELGFLSDLGDREACQLIAEFLDGQARNWSNLEAAERDRLQKAVRQALQFIVQRDRRPGMGGRGFSVEVTRAAQQAGNLEQVLQAYQNARATGSPDRHAGLAEEVESGQVNLLQLSFGLNDATLTEEQKQAVARAVLKRLSADDFPLGDARIARSVLAKLGQDPGDARWAELLTDSLNRRLAGDPSKEQLYDYMHLGAEALAEALRTAPPPQRDRLLQSLRRLFPKLHRQDAESLVRYSGGRNHHGQFIPEDVRQGRNLSQDPVQLQFDRMGADSADLEVYADALGRLKQQGVYATDHSLEALKRSQYRDRARFLDPLLDQPDPDGKVAEAIAWAAFEADSGKIYSGLRGDAVNLATTVDLLEHLVARQNQPLARQAALALLARLISGLDMRRMAASMRDRLASLLPRLPAGPEVLLAALRLKGEGANLDSTIEASRQKVFERVRQLAGQPESKPELDAAMERLGFAYTSAHREGRPEEAEAIRRVLDQAVAEAAGLPRDRQYLTEQELGGGFVWSRYDSHRRGSYLRDFVQVLGQVSPERRARLLERLPEIRSLGYAPDTQMYRLRDIEEHNEFTRDVSNLRAQLRQAEQYHQDDEVQRLRRRLEERVQEHERRQAANSGLGGRLRATAQLGDSFEALTAMTATPAQFDAILLKAGELPPATAQRVLQLAKGLDPDRLLTLLEVIPALPPETVAQILQQAGTPEEMSRGFADLALRRLRSYATGESDHRLVDRPGLRPSLAEKLASLVVADGRGEALMLDSDGGVSLMDRLIVDSRSDTDSRNAARGLLDQLDTSPNTPEGRLARLNRLQFRQAKEDPRQLLTESQSLRAEPDGLQKLVNLELTCTQAELLTRIPFPRDLRSYADELEQHLERVKAEQRSLPENLQADARYRGLSGQLEAARQRLLARQTQVLARLGEIEAQEAQRRLAQQLEFRGGMGYRAVRSLVSFALNSPKDSMFLAVQAEVGVKVSIPFFGEVKAFVRGRAGFDVAVDEAGQVSVSFDAQLSVGASARSERVGVGLSGQTGQYTRVSYVFANEDEAARFITNLLQQMKLTGEKPAYDPPSAVHHTGGFFEGELEFRGIKATRRTRDNLARVAYPVPWLPRDRTQQTEISTRTDQVGLSFPSRGRRVGLTVTAEDAMGSRNQTSNGTDLTLAFDVSRTASDESTQRLLDSPTDSLIDEMVESVFQMRPELLTRIPGHQAMNPEQLRKAARERILGAFTSQNIKASATARGVLEVTISCPDNLMQGEPRRNAMEVLFAFIGDSLASQPERPWFYKNSRVAAELTAGASLSLQYGAGVSVYAELGLEAGIRQTTTLAGSLWHAREVLYESRPNTYFSENQLQELKKDGLITSQDTLDREAFMMVLAKLRQELLSTDESWRRQHAPGQTSEQFTANVDHFIQEIVRGMWAGLKNTHRTYETFDEFNRGFNSTRIREAHQFLDDNHLGKNTSSEDALRLYRNRR